MTIAILETGAPRRPLIPRFGRYPDMFANLLGSTLVDQIYDVTQGEFPERPEDHGAYLITGSSAGVYDDLPWIASLKSFLIETKGKAKLVGICFGHQIMAEAFGGRVVKSDKGWGLGLHDYLILDRQPWMDDVDRVTMPVSHQDQVVDQPPRSRRIAGTDFCEIGGLAYEDHPSISFQFHPEFDPDFVAAIIDILEREMKDPDAARTSLHRPDDRARVGQWIRNFVGG